MCFRVANTDNPLTKKQWFRKVWIFVTQSVKKNNLFETEHQETACFCLLFVKTSSEENYAERQLFISFLPFLAYCSELIDHNVVLKLINVLLWFNSFLATNIELMNFD